MVEQHDAASSFGVLILHGFTGTLESVKALYAPLQEIGITVSMPLLMGHGEDSPEALRGVRWHEWLSDADRALQKLSRDTDRIIVIGHSMGSLLALNLAVKYPKKVDSLVLAAPAIKLASMFAPGRPMQFFALLISKLFKNWELKPLFSDPQCASAISHYSWVPTNAIISFFELIKQTLPQLCRVTVPVLVLQCRRDSTVLPESATILFNSIATEPSAKSLLWLEHSDHQLFCDGERVKAVQAIIDYVSSRMCSNRIKEDAVY
jgi:carboxylesterase